MERRATVRPPRVARPVDRTRRTGKPVAPAAVYIALRRLEKRGLVSSRLVGPEENGGRERRYFRIEEEGLERLKESRRALLDLWEGLAPQLDRR